MRNKLNTRMVMPQIYEEGSQPKSIWCSRASAVSCFRGEDNVSRGLLPSHGNIDCWIKFVTTSWVVYRVSVQLSITLTLNYVECRIFIANCWETFQYCSVWEHKICAAEILAMQETFTRILNHFKYPVSLNGGFRRKKKILSTVWTMN